LNENPGLQEVGLNHNAACWVDAETRKERS
jgi:hypothetical protein